MKKLLIASLLFASVSAFAEFTEEMTVRQVNLEVMTQLAAKVPPIVILRQARATGFDVTKMLISVGVDPSDIVESTKSGIENGSPSPFSTSRSSTIGGAGRSSSVSPS